MVHAQPITRDAGAGETNDEEDEMEQRGYSNQAQRPASAKRMPADIVAGTFRTADKITLALRTAAERFHLVSAGTSTAVPEGVAVALSPILVDVDTETYPIPASANRGLSKIALDRIAAAAGLSWDPVQTRRIDDGSHPYFVHYQAVGSVRDFDGSVRTYKAEKVLDMREGSPELETLVSISEAKLKKEGKVSAREIPAAARAKAENQIRQIRAHIIGHAESKAKNRVIRALGVRTSYTAAELAKPFVVARPVYTGESSDPDIARENAAAIRSAFLGAQAALYPAAPQLPAPTSAAPARERHRAPIDVTPAEDSGEWDVQDDEPEAPPPPPAETRQRRNTPPPSEPQESGEQQGPRPRETFQFGRSQGDVISEADGEEIGWYLAAIEKSIQDPAKERFRAQNEADAAYCRRVLERRAGEDGGY